MQSAATFADFGTLFPLLYIIDLKRMAGIIIEHARIRFCVAIVLIRGFAALRVVVSRFCGISQIFPERL